MKLNEILHRESWDMAEKLNILKTNAIKLEPEIQIDAIKLELASIAKIEFNNELIKLNDPIINSPDAVLTPRVGSNSVVASADMYGYPFGLSPDYKNQLVAKENEIDGVMMNLTDTYPYCCTGYKHESNNLGVLGTDINSIVGSDFANSHVINDEWNNRETLLTPANQISFLRASSFENIGSIYNSQVININFYFTEVSSDEIKEACRLLSPLLKKIRDVTININNMIMGDNTNVAFGNYAIAGSYNN